MKTLGPYVINERDLPDSVFDSVYDKLFYTNIEKIAGITLPKGSKNIGRGSQGVAYALPGNKVLKITEDDSEAKAASLISGKKLDGLYYVYGVFKMPDSEFYVVIQEKLSGDGGNAYIKFRETLGSFAEWLDSKAATNGEKRLYIKSVIHTLSMSDGWNVDMQRKWKEYEKSTTVPKESQDIRNGLVSLKKLGIDWNDLHGGNIMKSSRGWVIIDIGYSISSGKNIKTLNATKGPDDALGLAIKTADELSKNIADVYKDSGRTKFTKEKIKSGGKVTIAFSKGDVAEFEVTKIQGVDKATVRARFRDNGKLSSPFVVANIVPSAYKQIRKLTDEIKEIYLA